MLNRKNQIVDSYFKLHKIENIFWNKILFNFTFHNDFLLGYYIPNSNDSIPNLNDLSNLWNELEQNIIKKVRESRDNHHFFQWLISRMMIKKGYQFFHNKSDYPSDLYLQDISFINESRNENIIKNSVNPNKNLYYSISHTNDLIVSGLSFRTIGIDTECISSHSSEWKEKITSTNELTYIANFLSQKGTYSEDFLYTLIWALKESTLKCSGTSGLGNILKIRLNVRDNSIYSNFEQSKITYTNYFTEKLDSIIAISLK